MTDAATYAELHCHSAFSLLSAGSSVEALVARAAALGMPALALTDTSTLAGVVRFQTACVERGVRGIIGAQLAVADPTFGDMSQPSHLIVLAQNPTGYARLCQLLTDANLSDPGTVAIVPFEELAAHPEGLTILTGGRQGALARLVLLGRHEEAERVARRYADAFGPTCAWVELQHHRLPGSVQLLQRLAWIAEAVGLRVVATNGVRYVTRDEYPIYDLLTCARLGITVDQPHPERPRNDEAYLKGVDEMTELFAPFPWGAAALAATTEIADACDLSLLKAHCTAPSIPLPEGSTPQRHLRGLCEAGLRRITTAHTTVDDAVAAERITPYRTQLAHELAVIERLDLDEFFLCVHDIVSAARTMGIRCSGRGSAANSLVAYLLGITGVDPLIHGLLFERFLNPDRHGMPDIDIDVQSDRREELIRYVEQAYTNRHAAMVANVITYRARSALRDTLKALAFPFPLVNRLTKILHHHASHKELISAHDELTQIVRTIGSGDLQARCLARLPLALDLATRLIGLPRHLSLHNGGIVLTREPLTELLPVRVSANGMRALEVDKDDVERLGLIKFDVLGLRTLGAVEEALALIEETTGARPDIDALPTDPPDQRTMQLVRAGQTLAVFQIESPGQWHLLAQTQPCCFNDLIVQTALFRPGPLQANMVHPYVARRQEKQRDAVQTPWRGQPADTFWTAHPVLGMLLHDTEGILLFQEQILEIAHQFAGLSYAEADGFRRAMSHTRSPDEMEAMRVRFLEGAVAQGETPDDAMRTFDAISNFVGYGFCRSHAAEFAKTIYQTAWLKAWYPAHWLAAFLSCQPAGFFPPHVVLEEARQLGIPLLSVDVNHSAARFSVEQVGSQRRRWAIRIGLAQVAQVGEELAEAILWERRGRDVGERPFTSLTDFCARLRPAGLTWNAAEALALAGAFDSLRPHVERRQTLWRLHELWPLVGATGQRRIRGRGSQRSEEVEQLLFDWELALDIQVNAPALPTLSLEERLALDHRLLGMSTRLHPMRLMRRELRRQGVRAIADLRELGEGRIVRVAGWPISAQRPPTAKGMGFVVLEDETGRLPIALPPKLAAEMHRRLRGARAVTIVGRVERIRWYRSLLALDMLPIAT